MHWISRDGKYSCQISGIPTLRLQSIWHRCWMHIWSHCPWRILQPTNTGPNEKLFTHSFDIRYSIHFYRFRFDVFARRLLTQIVRQSIACHFHTAVDRFHLHKANHTWIVQKNKNMYMRTLLAVNSGLRIFRPRRHFSFSHRNGLKPSSGSRCASNVSANSLRWKLAESLMSTSFTNSGSRISTAGRSNL